METPLRGRSGGHTGTAPTVPFGQITCGRLVAFGQIARKWLFCLCGIAWKNMMEMGRGGACVPARVACRGASIVHPHAQCMYFWYGNVAARTFGRAHRQPPLRHDEIQDKQDGQDEERDVEPLVLCGAEL